MPHLKVYVIAFWQGIPRQNPAISLKCRTEGDPLTNGKAIRGVTGCCFDKILDISVRFFLRGGNFVVYLNHK
jgi:hypothetical protein